MMSSAGFSVDDRLSVLMRDIISSSEGVLVSVVLSKLLKELDELLRGGRRLLEACLDERESAGSLLDAPEGLLSFYGLQGPLRMKEGLSMEDLLALFHKEQDIKEEKDPLQQQIEGEGPPRSVVNPSAALSEASEDYDEEDSEDSDEEDEEEDFKSLKEDVEGMFEDGEDDESPSGRKKRSSRTCQLCHKVFSKDFKNFEVHVQQCEVIASHGEVRDGRTCPKCHKKYKRSYLIGRHLDLCQGDILENDSLWSRDGADGTLFKCQRCLKTYKSRHHFASHLATCEKRKKSSCSACNKYFPTREELERHPCPKFSGDQKFACQLCDYSCHYGPQLTKHYTSKHGGKRDYCCETCGKMYADPSVLATHRRTHAEPAHKCMECGKAFHRRATLTRHMTMHFSLNLPCETCGKCFSNQLYLNRHRNSQHPPDGIIVTHPCPHCSSSYREKKFLKKHIRDKHSFDALGPTVVQQQQVHHQVTTNHLPVKEVHQTAGDCKTTLLGLPFMHTIHS